MSAFLWNVVRRREYIKRAKYVSTKGQPDNPKHFHSPSVGVGANWNKWIMLGSSTHTLHKLMLQSSQSIATSPCVNHSGNASLATAADLSRLFRAASTHPRSASPAARRSPSSDHRGSDVGGATRSAYAHRSRTAGATCRSPAWKPTRSGLVVPGRIRKRPRPGASPVPCVYEMALKNGPCNWKRNVVSFNGTGG